jgi:hypothetical protein
MAKNYSAHFSLSNHGTNYVQISRYSELKKGFSKARLIKGIAS